MRIIADANIPYVREAFGAIGAIQTVPGRQIDPELVRSADILLVRSVTHVGPELLDGSRVRFVGTATIGTDHVDEAYLRDRGITFASAPGSNATSVAEYVVAALLVLGQRYGFALSGRTIGVIGVGNVGSRVVRMAEALGMRVLRNDPPLARSTGDPQYRPIESLFEADILTLHVPLTRQGPDATWEMVDARFLECVKPGAILMNTSRGAVVEEAALHQALRTGRLAAAVVDTWRGEPNINAALLQDVAIGTPHIAGYSLDGKVNATAMLYEAVCAWLGIEPTWQASSVLPAPEPARIHASADGDPDRSVHEVVRCVYDIVRDDQALRRMLEMPETQRGEYFDRLRATYPVRREFFNVEVIVPDDAYGLANRLAGLGFRVQRGAAGSAAGAERSKHGDR